jgi:hypothetical protein
LRYKVDEEVAMKGWLRRIRGAVGMGLTWAIAGFVAGMGIELIHNVWPNSIGSAVDIWPAALAYPGFLGGIAFSAVLGIAARRRRFDELTVPRVAAWGAIGGLFVSLIPAIMVATGLASTSEPVWLLTLAVAGPFMAGGAIAASATLALARMSEDRGLLEDGHDVAGVGLSREEERELLGDE